MPAFICIPTFLWIPALFPAFLGRIRTFLGRVPSSPCMQSSIFDKFIDDLQRNFAAHARRAKVLAASCPKLSSTDSFKDFLKALTKQEAESVNSTPAAAEGGDGGDGSENGDGKDADGEAKKPLMLSELMEEALRHVYDLVIERLEQASGVR